MGSPASRVAHLGRDMRPALDLVFTGTTLPSGVTFSRAGTATDSLFTDAAGSSYNTYAADVPRLLGSRGILFEGARVNYAKNSDSPATHTTVNVGTGSRTLWVIGTGSCAISAGTAVGTGWGTATAGSPVTVNITVSGNVTLTVSGTLTRFQLESASGPSSYIPNGSSTTTRPADIASIPYSPGRQTTVIAKGAPNWSPGVGNTWMVVLGDSTTSLADRMGLRFGVDATTAQANVVNSYNSSSLAQSGVGDIQTLVPFSMALSHNGVTLSEMFNVDNTVRNVVGMGNDLLVNCYVGSLSANSQSWVGFLERIRVWRVPLTEAQMQQIVRSS